MTRERKKVAIIGGGPAGAAAARAAAEAGAEAWLFHADGPHGEKPCGGGVTLRAFVDIPNLGIAQNPIHSVRVVSPRGRAWSLESEEPFFTICARGAFDAALRDGAAGAGARVAAERVVELLPSPGGVRVRTEAGAHEFDAAIGADGVFSKTRRGLGIHGDFERCPAVDEWVEGVPPGDGVTLVFYPDVTGYLWVFPRTDLASVGMVAREGQLSGAAMRARVRDYLHHNYPAARIVRSAGWAIPAPRSRGIVASELGAGPVLLAGDAAGLADPLTGEGISYAVRSGAIAGRVAASGTTQQYAPLLEEAFGTELRMSARLVERYFRPRILEAVLWLGKHHKSVRAILGDVMTGRQEYATLSERLTGSLAVLGWVLKRI